MTQVSQAADFLDQLPAADFDRPSVLPSWDVRMLAAHLLVLQTQIFATLECPTTVRTTTLPNYLRNLRHRHTRHDPVARELADHESAARLAGQVRQNVAELRLRLVDKNLPASVAAPGDPLSTVDYLRSVLIEWVAHTDDLNRSLPERTPAALDPQALAEAVRTLAEVLSKQNPGRSLEVRVPPYAAIQCGAGEADPVHTRGTPPAVVECGPESFLRLATGRLVFAEGVETGAVSASGNRADLSPMLPLIG